MSSTEVKILLVDDEPANLLALEALLHDPGQVLVRASSGEQALEKTATVDFAVILLDVRMPTMDGFETARLVRRQARSAATPIIFVTAFDESDGFIEEAYTLGAVDFLVKPVVPAVLKAKVAFFVELYRGRDDLRAQRAFLAAVLEAVEDGIVACDADGALTLFNRAALEFHGKPQEPLLPDRWAAHYGLYRPNGRTPLPLEEIPLFRALCGERVRDAEMVIAPPGGLPRTVMASGQALYAADGRKLGAVVSLHDITTEHEVELARQAAVLEQARRSEEGRARARSPASRHRSSALAPPRRRQPK